MGWRSKIPRSRPGGEVGTGQCEELLEKMRMAMVVRGDVRWWEVDDVVSRTGQCLAPMAGEEAEAGNLLPKAGEAAEGEGLALKVFEAVEAEDEEEDGEDILHEARAGVGCVEIAGGHKGPGADGARVRVSDVGRSAGIQGCCCRSKRHDRCYNVSK